MVQSAEIEIVATLYYKISLRRCGRPQADGAMRLTREIRAERISSVRTNSWLP
jgi:hypothetical protein